MFDPTPLLTISAILGTVGIVLIVMARSSSTVSAAQDGTPTAASAPGPEAYGGLKLEPTASQIAQAPHGSELVQGSFEAGSGATSGVDGKPSRPLIERIRNPSGLGVVAGASLFAVPFAWPLGMYIVLRYATGHRASPPAGTSSVRQPNRVAEVGLTQVPSVATTVPPAPTTKVCPDCAETVVEAARICRFCRYEFASANMVA